MITPPILTNELIEKFYNFIMHGKIEELKSFLSSLPNSTKEALARTPYRDSKKDPVGNEYQNPIYAAVNYDRLDVLRELLKIKGMATHVGSDLLKQVVNSPSSNKFAIVDELSKFKNLRLDAYNLLLEQLEERPINIPLVKKLLSVLKDDEEIAKSLAALSDTGVPEILYTISDHLELVQEALKIASVAKAASGPAVVDNFLTLVEPEVAKEILKLESFQQYAAEHADVVLGEVIKNGSTESVKGILAIPGVKNSESLSHPAFLRRLRNCNIEIFDLALELKPVRAGLISKKGLIFQILNIELYIPGARVFKEQVGKTDDYLEGASIPRDFIEKVKSLNKFGLSEINSLTFHGSPLSELEPITDWWLGTNFRSLLNLIEAKNAATLGLMYHMNIINPYRKEMRYVPHGTEGVEVIISELRKKAELWNKLYLELEQQISEGNVKSLQDVVESMTIGNTKEEALANHFKSTKQTRPKR